MSKLTEMQNDFLRAETDLLRIIKANFDNFSENENIKKAIDKIDEAIKLLDDTEIT